MPAKTKTSKASTTQHAKALGRKKLLNLSGVNDLFANGSISINKSTCRGAECRLCINACPTGALFWRTGEVGLAEELSIYCGACVLTCIVDNCIMITRTRSNGQVERFANPQQFIALQHKTNSEKRLGRIREAFPQLEKNPRHTKKIGKKC